MSLNTITQPINNITTVQWDYETIVPSNTYSIDPLACSVALHRKNMVYGLTDAATYVTPDDLAKADQIRNYYSKKYFWNSLKDKRPQSEYRLSAVRLLSITDQWSLTDREAGLFVKLVAFYEEDMFYDELKSKFCTSRTGVLASSKSTTQRLEYLGKTFRWQGNKRESFWFKDLNNSLYAYTTAYGHPFNVLFEELIQTPRMFEFSHGVDNAGEMYYNSIKSFKIIKEQNV